MLRRRGFEATLLYGLSSLDAELRNKATGNPHFGQFSAMLEMSLPHSGQLERLTGFLPHFVIVDSVIHAHSVVQPRVMRFHHRHESARVERGEQRAGLHGFNVDNGN